MIRYGGSAQASEVVAARDNVERRSKHTVIERYDTYKDSGIEWCGRIPESWEVRRVKEVAKLVNGATPKSREPKNWNGSLYWVTTDDLGKLKTRYIADTKRRITENFFKTA